MAETKTLPRNVRVEELLQGFEQRLQTQEAELGGLRRSLKRTRALLGLSLALPLMLLGGLRWVPLEFGTVTARTLALKDSDGSTRIALGYGGSSARLELRGPGGRPGLSLEAGEQGTSLRIPSRAVQGGPGVELASDEKFSTLKLRHLDGEPGKADLEGAVVAQSTFQGGARLEAFGAGGTSARLLGSEVKDFGAVLEARGAGGKPSVVLKAGEFPSVLLSDGGSQQAKQALGPDGPEVELNFDESRSLRLSSSKLETGLRLRHQRGKVSVSVVEGAPGLVLDGQDWGITGNRLGVSVTGHREGKAFAKRLGAEAPSESSP